VRPVRTHNWREWFVETFLRGGLFSIRPLPTTDAERRLAADEQDRKSRGKETTRLNIDSSHD
jgi:hypothetical protein